MADFLTDKPAKLQRAFLVGVQTSDMNPGEAAELLGELRELVENLRIAVTRTELVNLRRATPALLLGSGKAKELADLAKAEGADVIVFDEALSPAQQRNWEELSGLAVIDRQEVILEIFSDRAHTREAVLQVALARMEYSLPRLTRAWTHLSRQRGKGAMGGEGETQLEQDRRTVRDRITHLKAELKKVVSQRSVQRTKRQRVPIPTCAIVGYTNAGTDAVLDAGERIEKFELEQHVSDRAVFLGGAIEADERRVADGFGDVVVDASHNFAPWLFWFELLLTTQNVVVWFKIKVEACASTLCGENHPRNSNPVKLVFWIGSESRL